LPGESDVSAAGLESAAVDRGQQGRQGHVRERSELVSGEDAYLVEFSARHLHDEPAARRTGPDNCRTGAGAKSEALPVQLPPSDVQAPGPPSTGVAAGGGEVHRCIWPVASVMTWTTAGLPLPP